MSPLRAPPVARRYHSGMDPTIAGALIGGSAGLIGLGASAWSTAVTLRGNRETARDQRLWEKQSALYELLLQPVIVVDSDHLDAIFDGLAQHRDKVMAYASDVVLLQYTQTIQALADSGLAKGLNDEAHRIVVALDETAKLSREIRRGLHETPRRGPLWHFMHPGRVVRLGGQPLP